MARGTLGAGTLQLWAHGRVRRWMRCLGPLIVDVRSSCCHQSRHRSLPCSEPAPATFPALWAPLTSPDPPSACEHPSHLPRVREPVPASQIMGPLAPWLLPAGPTRLVGIPMKVRSPPSSVLTGLLPKPSTPTRLLHLGLLVRTCPVGSWQEGGGQGDMGGWGRDRDPGQAPRPQLSTCHPLRGRRKARGHVRHCMG